LNNFSQRSFKRGKEDKEEDEREEEEDEEEKTEGDDDEEKEDDDEEESATKGANKEQNSANSLSSTGVFDNSSFHSLEHREIAVNTFPIVPLRKEQDKK
jgi:hypothetical protein